MSNRFKLFPQSELSGKARPVVKDVLDASGRFLVRAGNTGTREKPNFFAFAFELA
jgi:hypothetical protein